MPLALDAGWINPLFEGEGQEHIPAGDTTYCLHFRESPIPFRDIGDVVRSLGKVRVLWSLRPFEAADLVRYQPL
jgi:hypothetical protein